MPPHSLFEAYRRIPEANSAYDKTVLAEYIQEYGLYPIDRLAKLSSDFLAWVMVIGGKGTPKKVHVVENLRFSDTKGDFSQTGKFGGIVNSADCGGKAIEM